MLADLKPYPEMRDSGIEWLGEVPAHWEVRRIKTLFREKDKRNDDGHGELLSLTRSYGLLPQKEASNRIASTEDLSNYKVCRPDDLVMNRMQAWSGMFAVPSREGLISPDYSVFELVNESEVKYFEQLFKTSIFVGQFAQESRGIGSGFNRLYTADFGSIPTVVPPLPEQVAIVRFLDHADRRIRRYIRAKQKLIALLEEQKQVLIHQAVTGQIDVHTGHPYPDYKDSGVEWLGQVPKHWSIRRLCTLVSIATGKMDTINKQADGRYPFFVRSQTVERIDTWSFDGEAVLTAGDGVGVGKVFHYVNGKFNFHQRVYRFSDFRDVYGRFFFEYLRAMLRCEVMQGTAKATVDSLRLPMLRNFSFALPPPDEQTEIVNFLNDTVARIDHGVAHTRHEIGLLREYHSRLIVDVVAGRLDVRVAEAALPKVEPPAAGDGPEE